MRLKFMQQGGFMPPYTIYLPVMTNTGSSRYRTGSSELFGSSSSSSSKTSDSSEKGEITNKDLLSMLSQIDALPSDMAAIEELLTSFYRMASIPGMVDSSDLALQYIKTVFALKSAKFNKAQYDKIYDETSKKRALDEYALSNNGKVVLTNGKDLKFMSVENFVKVQQGLEDLDEEYEGYAPVTNDLILNIRAYNDPNDTTYTNILANAISMPEVNDMIHKYLKNIGSTEITNSKFESRKGADILSGVEQLQDAADSGLFTSSTSLAELYELTNTTTTKTNKALIDLALQYIIQALPDNAKSLLKLHSDGTDEGAKNVVAHLLTSGEINVTKTVSKEKQDDGTGNNRSGSKSSTTKTGSTELSPVMSFLMGTGYQEQIRLNPGSAYSIKVNGRIGVLADDKGNAIGTGHNLSEIGNSLYASSLDLDHATFGGHNINLLLGNQSLLKNTDIVLVELPIDLDAPSGVVRPDIAMCHRLEEAEDEIRFKQISESDFESINEIYKSHELPPKFVQKNTNNGVEWVLNSPEYKTFAMVQAVVNGKMITDTDKLSSEDINDNLVERITDDAQIDGYLQQMRDASPGKKLDFDNTNLFWFFDLVDHMYEGNVFIPVRVNSYINASLLVPSASKTKIPISDAMELHQQELMMRQQSLNNPGTRYVAPPQINFTE